MDKGSKSIRFFVSTVQMHNIDRENTLASGHLRWGQGIPRKLPESPNKGVPRDLRGVSGSCFKGNLELFGAFPNGFEGFKGRFNSITRYLGTLQVV